jgi:uncharacterized DUF497 family protein
MRLVGDEEMAAWLDTFPALAEDFEWDTGNRSKNLKHGVHAEDIEGLFREPIVFAGRIAEPLHDEPRSLLLGRDPGGRLLALIFTRRGEKLRPISCRRMRRKEKGVYEDALQSEREKDPLAGR